MFLAHQEVRSAVDEKVAVLKNLPYDKLDAALFGYVSEKVTDVKKLMDKTQLPTEVETVEQQYKEGKVTERQYPYMLKAAKQATLNTINAYLNQLTNAVEEVKTCFVTGNNLLIRSAMNQTYLVVGSLGEKSIRYGSEDLYKLPDIHTDTLNEVKSYNFNEVSDKDFFQAMRLISLFFKRGTDFNGSIDGIPLELDYADKLLAHFGVTPVLEGAC